MSWGTPALPSNTANAIAVSALAAAIGAAVPVPPTAGAIGAAVPQPSSFLSTGQRIVNPASLLTTASGSIAAAGSSSAVIDLAGSLSFSLILNPFSSVGATTIEVNLLWLNADNSVRTSRVYEFSAAGGPMEIQDRCLAAKLQISYHAVYGGGAPGALLYDLQGSALPIDTNRLLCGGASVGGLFGNDGLILVTGVQTLAAGVASSVFIGGVSNGRAMIDMSAGTGNGPFEFRFFWGQSSGAPIFLFDVATTANVSHTFQEIPMVPRALCLKITNKGTTSGSAQATVWTDPNSHT